MVEDEPGRRWRGSLGASNRWLPPVAWGSALDVVLDHAPGLGMLAPQDSMGAPEPLSSRCRSSWAHLGTCGTSASTGPNPARHSRPAAGALGNTPANVSALLGVTAAVARRHGREAWSNVELFQTSPAGCGAGSRVVLSFQE